MTQLFAEFNDPTKRVLVISDLEPDDYLAIFMLVATTKCQLTFIASCWTNPVEKAAILRKLLSDAGSSAPVYHGIPSDRVYDLGKLRVLLGMNDLPAEPPAYTAALIEAADVIISLAPPQELIAAHAANSPSLRARRPRSMAPSTSAGGSAKGCTRARLCWP